MKKISAMALCAVCLNVAGWSAQKQGDNPDPRASLAQFVMDRVKAQTSNNARWLRENLVNGYVEGTSFGTWVPKSQLIEDVGDRDKKYTKDEISYLNIQVVGDVGVARFTETYDATIGGQRQAGTMICSMTAQKQASTWKALSTHCSKSG